MSNNANDPGLRSVAESFDAAAQVLDDAIPEEVRPSLLREAPNDSSQHSHTTSVINNMDSLAQRKFPIMNIHSRPLTADTKQRLIKLLQLPSTFFERLTACGYTLPHRIVNTFGGGVKTVATAFGEMNPSLLYGESANTALLLVKFSKLELRVSPTVEEFSENKRSRTRLGRNYSKKFNSLTEDEMEDKIEEILYREDMAEYKVFMKKVHQQLKVWLRRDGPPSKIQTISSGNSNVSSMNGSVMEKQVSNNSNVDNNNIKQSPNRSLSIRKSKVPPSIPSKQLDSRKGADVHEDIANNIAQNSFAKTPAPNIISNDNGNVNTTAPISPYDKEYVQGCNTNVIWQSDEYSDHNPD